MKYVYTSSSLATKHLRQTCQLQDLGTAPHKTETPLQLYRIQLTKDKNKHLQPESDSREKEKKEIPLLCSRCSAPITTSNQAVSINGQHEHAFFNPAGIAFEIRCFRQAPGCLVQGEPTTEFSWFDGYSWQYAICSNCLAHLGWFFSSEQNSFFGLIAGKLI